MNRPLPHDHPDRLFCGTCGNPVHGKRQDPYTGELLVEVEIHAIPDDIAGDAPSCDHPEAWVIEGPSLDPPADEPRPQWCARCGALRWDRLDDWTEPSRATIGQIIMRGRIGR